MARVDRGLGLGLALGASRDDENQFDTSAWTDDLIDNGDDYDEDEEDDLGMGVSTTVNKRRTPDPKYVNAEGMENAILDLATATQNVIDKLDEDDAEMEAERRKETEAAAAADVEDADGDYDLGMGVSDTVPAPKGMLDTFGEGGRSGQLERAMSNMQGADQIREMESLTARDQKRAEMEERGLSKEQIAAYLGDASPAKAPTSRAEEAKAREGKAAARSFKQYSQAAFVESSAWRAEQDLLKVAPSSSMVKLDEQGEPLLDRFVYVDEYTCIGCTHCNHEAPSTFFMEEDYGRARVYQQGRDTDEAVRTAIETCPVDCIHYVDWPELVRLEKEREGIDINFKAKLVGNDHDNAVNGMQRISGNESMRCENCPSRGCYNCPMFGVGNNPAYAQRKEERKAKRVARLKKEREERSGGIKTADL
eukprot:g4528.t1